MGQGVKFFDMNYCDINNDPIYDVSNNDALQESMFDRDELTIYTTSGLNSDSLSVTIEIDFDKNRTFDNLLIINTNIKDFTFDYWNGSIWVNIITETANAATTYNGSFADITATKVRLIANKTIVADEEKTIEELIVTNEVGQFQYFPMTTFKNNKNQTVKEMINGKSKVVLNRDSKNIEFNFKDHLGDTDRGLFITLFNYNKPVLIWLSGGDEDQFVHGDEGYRLRDIYLMAIDKNYSHKFTKNLYFSGMRAKLRFLEVV